MFGLTDMPDELLGTMCSFLCIDGDERSHGDLSRLSRTCRHLRDTLQPLVFMAFVRRNPSRAQLTQLLRALELRHDLAHCLKHMEINDVDCSAPLSDTDIQYLNTLIAKLNLPPPPPSEFSSPSSNPWPLVELILLHTPRLRHLHLPLKYECTFFFLPTSLSAHNSNSNNNNNNNNPKPGPTQNGTSPRTGLLSNLHTLQLNRHPSPKSESEYDHDHYHEHELGLAKVLTLCAAAPHLEELFTYNPGGSGGSGFDDGSLLELPLHNLRRLEFDGTCRIPPAVLRGMVASAPKLEVLGLSWDPTGDNHHNKGGKSGGGECTVAEVWEILMIRRQTLREVRLDIHQGDTRHGGEILPVGLLGWSSLMEFERLEVLKVGNFALSAVRDAWIRETRNEGRGAEGFLEGLLPWGIREVTLWQPDGDLIMAVRRLAEVAVMGRYRELERVIVGPSEVSEIEWSVWEGREEWLRASLELQLEFERDGVTFEAYGQGAQALGGPFPWLNPYRF